MSDAAPATTEDTASTERTASSEEKRVVRNDDAGRYEIWIGDALGGFTEFAQRSDGRVEFPHTEVDPAFKGQRLGGILVGEALAETARRGETIVPLCPFVQKYLRENDVAGAVIDWPHSDDAQNSATPGEPPA
jgi:predicted GNAT family acetyltransferase